MPGANPNEADGPLYHMVQRGLWEASKTEQKPYVPPTYDQDGFTHLTKDPKFLLGIGNHFYKQVSDDFLLLVLDPTKLSAKVVFEPAAPVGNTASDGLTGDKSDAPLFPHLYGSIDHGAVLEELPISRESTTGKFLAIPGLNL